MSTIVRNEDCFFTKSQDSRFEGDNMVCAGVVRVRTKSALVLQTTMELQPIQLCVEILCFSLHCALQFLCKVIELIGNSAEMI